jgi:hypothetical protein
MKRSTIWANPREPDGVCAETRLNPQFLNAVTAAMLLNI